ncbi:MAG: hypothetical protein Tp136SUR676911_43 [Prokaryotic dsDNA virus sp.]|jgi:hypothetical protein|nr:MAG: hypothetical protein Tp136SUR676911_43 [Prokaryotic dsDNA virus sp.]|tara:strand:- start:28388 stop:28804 length:417 start_codon:yes stop_codon:yes gene_type:complete
MKLSDMKDPDTLSGKVEHDGIDLTILSTESSVYSAYIRSIWRENLVKGDDAKKRTPAEQDTIDREAAAHLIKEWNLDDELTIENACELLRKKRALIDKIYIEAGRLGKPEPKPSTDSSDGAKDSSSSGKKSTRKTRKA